MNEKKLKLDTNTYLFTTTGEVVLISPEDFIWMKGITLYYTKSTGYVQANLNGSIVHMQRLVLGLCDDDKRVADHINRNPLDNRRENLRTVDHATNHHNIEVKGSMGVERRYNGRYRAYIKMNYRKTYLGTYATFEEAQAVYIKKKKELSGL